MKKIFLPVLALCGMITGLTLTSCGGGGGGATMTGRTYDFNRTPVGSMRIEFLSSNITNEGESYQALVCFKEGENKYSNEDDCTVNIRAATPADDATQTVAGDVTAANGIEITISGMGSDVLEENALMAFLGVQLRANEDAEIGNYTFYVTAPALPSALNEEVTGCKLTVQELTVVVDNNNNDDNNNANPDDNGVTLEEGAQTVREAVHSLSIIRVY